MIIPSPVAKKVCDDSIGSELDQQGWYSIAEKSFDESLHLSVALVECCLTGAKHCALLGQFGDIVMHVLGDGLRIWPGRQRLERSRHALLVEPILFNAFSGHKTLSLQSGKPAIFVFNDLLKPQTILPTTPDLVFCV